MGSSVLAETTETVVADTALEAPPSNGWTGGQYSVFRVAFGVVVVSLFTYLALRSWQVGWQVQAGVAAAGILLGLLFLIGLWHRTAAVLLICLVLPLQFYGEHDFGPGPMIAALVLALHAFVPANPLGSWAARVNTDPGGGWRMSGELHLAGWVFLSLLYIGQGVALYRFQDEMLALERSTLLLLVAAHGGFGLLCVARLLRPWAWLLMLGVQVYVILSPLDWGWVIWVLPLHLFVFDPAWIRPASLDEAVITFYDGDCGLCHRAVRFVLSEDRTGLASDFACLGGPTFEYVFGENQELADSLPDSMVVHREDGTLLVKSAAMMCLMRRLGGVWRLAAWGLGLLPLALRDWFYDFVARRRRRWFGPPEGTCPLISARLRERFLDIDA
ncbi:MAG: thiol-disulfide oxidoreductase DCC family protein [Planctomycetota bacterium]|jgi:predicted DCC family thiol-disulfide oxidoreductase YuxK